MVGVVWDSSVRYYDCIETGNSCVFLPTKKPYFDVPEDWSSAHETLFASCRDNDFSDIRDIRITPKNEELLCPLPPYLLVFPTLP
jgi:hypothetical protein